MPMIQLIRRDGQIIELQAETVAFGVQRNVSVWAIPIFGVRAGFDLNNNLLNININGVLTDDTEASGSNGAVAEIDLSRPTGLYDSWFKQQQAQGNNAIADIVSALHGMEMIFKSAGQVSAGLGEDIALRFYSSAVPAATVATNSIIPVNISGVIAYTGDIATAINAALAGATVKVNTISTTIPSIFTVSQGAGQKVNSGPHQSTTTLTNEKITIVNIIQTSDGNTLMTKRGSSILSSQNWPHSFYTTNFNKGVSGSRKSKGDKVQDLLDMTVNVSAGGGMLSPQSFTGDLIELPDAISSMDVSKLLKIEQSDSVKKNIIGLRIPYESIVTATGSTEVIRQFIIPSGPGKNYPSEKNTEPFDPVDIIGGESIRPNPFFRQGVAIPGIIQTFEPSFEAGDSVWTYTLNFAACEQLIGI